MSTKVTAELTVGDLMHDADNLIMADEPVQNAKPQFDLETTRSLILVDGSGPIGLLTRSTVRDLAEADWGRPAREFATPVPTLTQSHPIMAARDAIEAVEFDADRLPVVNSEGRLVGSILRETLMRETETAHADRGMVRVNGDSGRTTEIHSGMEVRGAGDEKLGKIDDIVIERDIVAAFTISHGLLGRRQKRITAEHVASVDADAIHLDFGKTEFGLLPDIDDIEQEESRT
jgi:CBS domain-containing protein